MSNLSELYSKKFYDNTEPGSRRSAELILPLLYKYYKPESVLDFGCGLGGWLAVAGSLGSKKLVGLDGEWVLKENFVCDKIEFVTVNLEADIDIKEKYDLCICVEVAEHLSEKVAKKFINTLCKSSDVILFSAATKLQEGENHINCQWQSYWIGLFDNNNYRCFDYVRPQLWNDYRVDWWYTQNIFLFINKDFNNQVISNFNKKLNNVIYDLIHPKHLEQVIEDYEFIIANNKSELSVSQTKLFEIEELISKPSLKFLWKSLLNLIKCLV